jgi:catechol 2,3-dioxygenase-like lactoylglutathione lyase family enzyme
LRACGAAQMGARRDRCPRIRCAVAQSPVRPAARSASAHWGRASGLDGEQLPGPRDAFEFVLPAIAEFDPRPDDEVLDRPGGEHFTRVGERRYPGGDMDRQPPEVFTPDLALARVNLVHERAVEVDMASVNFLNAVLIVSDDAPKLAVWYLAVWYREVLGLPLDDEQHDGGGGALHFGCNLRGLHFAIHPTENYRFASETGRGGIRIAFNVGDIEQFVTDLEGKPIDWVFRPVDLGWSTMLAIRDPDGNMIEVLEMTAGV